MNREILSHIPDVNLFPILSLILFFTVFVLIVVFAWKARGEYIDHMSQLPLESSEKRGEV